MKKLFSVIALTALVLSLPSASFAAKAKGSPTPSDSPAATRPIPMYSEVSSIDVAGKTWTHKNKDGKEVKFVVTDKTDIKNNKAPANFEEIKVGDWVAGMRLKKSDTEYEVTEITKFGPRTNKSANPSAPSAVATPAKAG